MSKFFNLDKFISPHLGTLYMSRRQSNAPRTGPSQEKTPLSKVRIKLRAPATSQARDRRRVIQTKTDVGITDVLTK